MTERAIGRLDAAIDIVLRADPPADLDLAALPGLIRSALAAEGATGAWEIALVLTDDAGIQALHRDFLGLDTPTDVMTFPLGEEPDGTAAQGGDIVVSSERAAAQAGDFGHSSAEEVRFLLLHGLLHLLGWDDGSEAERTAMLDRQAALLAAFRERPGSST